MAKQINMKLHHRLQLYLFIIHCVFMAMIFSFYAKYPLTIISAEIGLIFSFSLGFYLVKKNLQPSALIKQFKELLQDEHYATRIRTQSNQEMNELISLFNQMLDNLYQERIQLGEQRGFLERLLEATPSAVVVFDFNGRISLSNHSAQQLLASLMLPNDSEEHFFHSQGNQNKPKDFLDELKNLSVGESKLISDQEGRRFRCLRSQFIDRGFNRDFLLIDEITLELANSEKSTYEKLVRVLAHEVNNTVAATGSVLESLLFYRQQLNHDDQVDFSTAITATQRRNTNLGEFIDRFTQVVKMPELVLRPCQINDLIDDLLILYRQQCIDLGIQVYWDKNELVDPVMIDSQLFEQALMNIIKNAIEAIISAQKNMSHSHPFININLSLEPDINSLCLKIIDSGKGLIDIQKDQLFTPFFTTKKGGQGIGLLFVREVFNRHEFAHRLSTNEQGDTQFSIWIHCTSKQH